MQFYFKASLVSPTREVSKGEKKGVVVGAAPWDPFLVFGELIGSLIDRGGLVSLFFCGGKRLHMHPCTIWDMFLV